MAEPIWWPSTSQGPQAAIDLAARRADTEVTPDEITEAVTISVTTPFLLTAPIATERVAEFGDALAPVLARVPSRRMSTIDEVASVVVYLADPHAANVHGAILTVAGGATAV